MIIGGFDNSDAVSDVEIIDLSGQNKTCRKPANFPIKGASNGLYFDGNVLVCGGGDPNTNKCFKYNSLVIIK